MARSVAVRSGGRVAGISTPSASGWDWLLLCTAGYLVMAVARVHVFYPPLTRIRPTLIVAGFALLVYVLDRSRIRSIGLGHPLVRLTGFIIFWATFTAPFGLYLGGSVQFLFDELYKVGLLFLLLAAAVRNTQDVRRLIVVYVYGCAALGAYVLVSPRNFVGGYDSNDVAMVLVSALPLAIHLLLGARAAVDKLPLLLSLSICITGVVVTGSRGGFVSLAAAVVFSLFFFRGIKRFWRIATVVGVAGLIGIAGGQAYWSEMRSLVSLGEDYNVTSFTGRKQIWLRGIGYMAANPLTGVGIDNFKAAEGQHPVVQQRQSRGRGTKWSVAHSAWVQVGAELGLPGLLSFLALFGVAAKGLYRIRQNRARRGVPVSVPDASALAEALLGALFAVAVGISFLSQAYGYALWALLGLAMGLFKVVRVNALLVAPGTRSGPRAGRGGWQFAPQR